MPKIPTDDIKFSKIAMGKLGLDKQTNRPAGYRNVCDFYSTEEYPEGLMQHMAYGLTVKQGDVVSIDKKGIFNQVVCSVRTIWNEDYSDKYKYIRDFIIETDDGCDYSWYNECFRPLMKKEIYNLMLDKSIRVLKTSYEGSSYFGSHWTQGTFNLFRENQEYHKTILKKITEGAAICDEFGIEIEKTQ